MQQLDDVHTLTVTQVFANGVDIQTLGDPTPLQYVLGQHSLVAQNNHGAIVTLPFDHLATNPMPQVGDRISISVKVAT